jgi:hypothetical protein
MTRREMTFQTLLASSLVVGIAGGNFLVQRWYFGHAASRVVDAAAIDGHEAESDDIDWNSPDLAPRRAASSTTAADESPAARRQRLIEIIAAKLPEASAEERTAWLEQLQDLSPGAASGILELRQQVGSLRD